jgi:hypothetical protein
MLRNQERNFTLLCFIAKADNNVLTLLFDKTPDDISLKDLVVSFEFNKNFYSSAETSIRMISVPLKSIELFPIEKMSFHAMRRYTRVEVPDNIEMLIRKVEKEPGESVSTFDMSELPATLRNIYTELKGESPDIKKIGGMVGEELTRFSNRYKINIFKDNGPKSPLEKVVAYYKKTFWVEDTDNMNNYIHLRDKYNVIGYEKYFELSKKQLAPDILEEVRHNYLNRGISSYAMVPILIGEKVVGVIEVSVPSEGNFKKLSVYEIFYIKGLADILGEVIVKAKGGSSGAYSGFKIIDISLGGILANTKDVYLAHNVKENSMVQLVLRYQGKEIEVKSRVIRYNYIPGENAGLNVAFEFNLPDESVKVEIGGLIRSFLKIAMEKQQTAKNS